MVDSLWGESFNESSPIETTAKILNKINNPKQIKKGERVSRSKALSLEDRLSYIKEEVFRKLGVYKEQTIVLKTREQLHNYITKALENKIIAVDTETNNSLDPITCKLLGPCIYTLGMKNAYIPINHINPYTRERLPWQLTEQDVKEEFSRLVNMTIIMHNGKFDYKVLKCTCGLDMEITWDTMIGAKILDENEYSAGLKQQYIEKIDPSIEKYSIDELFEGVEYAVVDPEIFALYSATDPYMTFKLYDWQKVRFEQPGMERVYNVFRDIEMPMVKVLAHMELTGITFDKEYASRLSAKYHKKLDSLDEQARLEIAKLQPQIDAWRLTKEANEKQINKNGNEGKSKSEQLEDPIKLSSPTQLAILLYDVLKVESVDKKTPRGTGEEVLKKLNLPICQILLQRRGVSKLLEAFIDSLPTMVNEKTGRIHCNFNSLGAATGRMSSSEPNLQQIPSHEKSIRMLFKAQDGYVLVGSDYSQQEPRLLSHFSHDDNMINAYKQGKDLYATIATGVYNNNYEDNLEHLPDGSLYEEGKKRRTSMKSLLLGIMYGRGVASIAEQIKGTVEEAQKIIDDFYKSFPKVKDWMDATQKFAKQYGYVEDLWGRRRHLPDIQLPKYTVKYFGNKKMFNPFLICENVPTQDDKLNSYVHACTKLTSKKDFERLCSMAYKDGIEILDNGGYIAQAERQAVNARIQGTAASMTKIAMIKIDNDEELKNLGFSLLVAVHDEVIGECPKENANKVADRLSYLMKSAVEDICDVPFKCDPDISDCWYRNEYISAVQKEYKNLLKECNDASVAFERLCLNNSESTREQLSEFVNVS